MGKTTIASVLGVRAAADGQRVLVISTDPAPSLGDVFGRPIGGSPRTIPVRRGVLHAVEVDSARVLERWLSRRRDSLERVAVRGTWLDRDDVAGLLRLSLPGIDEIAALFEIARLGRSGRYDAIVVDTAPTGHTLRMLAMPDTLSAIASAFESMQGKHRALVGALRGRWEPDADDELIADMERDARDLRTLLRDASRVGMSWLTLPEPMAVAETADAVHHLIEQHIPVPRIIINRVTPPPSRPCGWCDARRTFENRAIAAVRAAFPRAPLAVVAARDREPRGVRALAAIGSDLDSSAPARARPGSRARAWRGVVPRQHADVLAHLASSGTRLVMFGGKGGVGKTTCAAAAAIELAHRSPARRVLLLSTDPAHSLADVLGEPLSDSPRRLRRGPRNLTVRELDAAQGYRQVRDRYAAAIDAVFDRLSRGSTVDASFDRRVMQDLIELAPPGVDELAAVIDVTDALGATDGTGRYDLIVMDTAPSGHALRLLEMPAVVQDWAKSLMAILLKYRALGGLGELGPLLLTLSKGLGRLRQLLTDPAQTMFVAVTRPARLPRAETTRVIRRLAAMRIPVPLVVVNAVGRGTCARCRRASDGEAREIAAIDRAVRGSGAAERSLAIAPGVLPPPHGAAALRAWVRTWHPRVRTSRAKARS